MLITTISGHFGGNAASTITSHGRFAPDVQIKLDVIKKHPDAASAVQIQLGLSLDSGLSLT